MKVQWKVTRRIMLTRVQAERIYTRQIEVWTRHQ